MVKKIIGIIILVFTGVYNFIDSLSTIIGIPETFIRVQSFINSNQELGYQLLPWGLMVIGFLLILYPFPFKFLHNNLTEILNDRVSSIRVIFDPTNPSQRYWQLTNKLDSKTGKQFPVHFYRVMLKNTSAITIENVRATVETTGSHGMFPQFANAQIDNEQVFAMHPNEERFVDVIIWPHPIRQPGFPAGATAREMYGDLKITVHATNLPRTVKMFKFDYEKEPMIYES